MPQPTQTQASEDLARKKVRDASDFEWLKQCRFAWRDDRDTAVISICDVDFEYSYEYLGGRQGAGEEGWRERTARAQHPMLCSSLGD